jgi:flagellar biosynthesis/type III secretory pathway chaperone
MPLIGRLIQTVEQLLAEHEKLLRIEEKKKQVLIDGDMAKLQELVNEEVRFVRSVEKLEEERVKIGEQIAREQGIRLEELTASKLAELEKDPERAAKFNLLTGRFAKVIGELKSANELNGRLIRQSLDLLQRSIDMMTDYGEQGTYTGKGDSGAGVGQKRLFDTQV